MTNNKSAKKRVKINNRNRIHNNNYKGLIKNFTKKILQSLKVYLLKPTDEKKKRILNLLNITYSQIDKAKNKNIISKNAAAHKKSRLIKKLNKTIY
ncbi:MAG: 30S ribosomal protein S20 [Alphaproteobacteria bacterium]|nr:30S ribosomal protein S20 [Alphaproteobacteria bacterium]